MKNKILILFLLIMPLSACATTKDQKLTEAISLMITGAYKGEAIIEGDLMKVSLSGIETDRLSTYRNVKPLTGGNRVLLYFDTDMEEDGAEYCAFIYSDEVVFRKNEVSGWYINEMAVLKYFKQTGNIYFSIPLEHFEYKPFKAWTHRMD